MMSTPSGQVEELEHVDTLLGLSPELMSSEGFESGIQQVLSLLGTASGSDRAWLFDVQHHHQRSYATSYLAEWVSDPRHSNIDDDRLKYRTVALDSEGVQDLYDSRRKGALLFHQKASVEGFLGEEFSTQGIESMLTIPVLVEGEWWGVIGLDDCDRPRQYGPEIRVLLKIAAQLIAQAVLVRRVHRLSKSLEMSRQSESVLLNALSVPAALYNAQTQRISTNRAFKKMQHLRLSAVPWVGLPRQRVSYKTLKFCLLESGPKALFKPTDSKPMMALSLAGRPLILFYLPTSNQYQLPSQAQIQEVYQLTRREAVVCLALLGGAPPKKIATQLGLSVYTVREYLSSIYQKTGAGSQLQLVNLINALPVDKGCQVFRYAGA